MKEDFLDKIISELSVFDWKSRVDKRQAKKVIKMLEDLKKQRLNKEEADNWKGYNAALTSKED